MTLLVRMGAPGDQRRNVWSTIRLLAQFNGEGYTGSKKLSRFLRLRQAAFRHGRTPEPRPVARLDQRLDAGEGHEGLGRIIGDRIGGVMKGDAGGEAGLAALVERPDAKPFRFRCDRLGPFGLLRDPGRSAATGDRAVID